MVMASLPTSRSRSPRTKRRPLVVSILATPSERVSWPAPGPLVQLSLHLAKLEPDICLGQHDLEFFQFPVVDHVLRRYRQCFLCIGLRSC